jgi:hypothetical protein
MPSLKRRSTIKLHGCFLLVRTGGKPEIENGYAQDESKHYFFQIFVSFFRVLVFFDAGFGYELFSTKIRK